MCITGLPKMIEFIIMGDERKLFVYDTETKRQSYK